MVITYFFIYLPIFLDNLQCSNEDYVDIGGASHLDPSLMDIKETICGREPAPAKMVCKSYKTNQKTTFRARSLMQNLRKDTFFQ